MTYVFQTTEESSIFLPISRDVVLVLAPWLSLRAKLWFLVLALTLGLKPLLTFLLVCYEYLILHKIWLHIDTLTGSILVRFNNLFLCNVIDVHLFERAQEARLRHHAFRRLPRNLLDALQYHDTLTHRLHRLGRFGERSDLGDVILVEVVECKTGGF